MSRDHKNTPRVKPAASASNSSQSGGGLFTGIVIGLILGVVISVGVVFFVNKKMMNSPTPALKPAEPQVTSLPKPSANGVTTGEAPASEVSTKSKYDFFDVLPGTEPPSQPVPDATATETPPPAANTPSNTTTANSNKPSQNKTDLRQDSASNTDATATAAAKKTEEKPAASRAVLQIGSFQNEADADNLKAKLAIIGVEASIREKDIPGKGIWHRVMAGPYNADEANKVKALLQQNGMNPSLINIK
ncbi:SPOR domain-containing protein [Leeia sp. TBRC 13508]|uniref:SPOR domain-containing protein n=1 Tax=Leeia speluncae TaxID=2884804 RepID=A0ABS8D3Q9_9NEIS|nr:SPOR domain-containing protein [Leeia speluncae]MCB6182827.1 SPOR domain-containing protein [Leeia speluncae]